jgi:hypothetical protein
MSRVGNNGFWEDYCVMKFSPESKRIGWLLLCAAGRNYEGQGVLYLARLAAALSGGDEEEYLLAKEEVQRLCKEQLQLEAEIERDRVGKRFGHRPCEAKASDDENT